MAAVFPRITHPPVENQVDAMEVEGQVQKKMDRFNLVHLLTKDERVFVLTAHTRGIDLDALREGQWVRCQVIGPRRKVVSAQLMR